MSYKVFFAFQMDIEEKIGKEFIQSAIEIAKAQFKKDGIDIILDFGFRGTPGTPLLIEEMLKKSNDSDMVLVDLTYTSSKEWLNAEIIDEDVDFRWLSVPKIDRKPSPNPNVLLETGYAWAKKGTYRTLVIMNEAFGSPDDLPVDLTGFRWGITFNLNDSNYSERKKIRTNLAADLYKAIKSAINSETDYQREKWNPLRIHKDWSHKNFKFQFYATNRIKIYIKQLRTALKNPENPQRIIGPKNSGKSRLVFELYKEIDTNLPLDIDIENVIYYDLGFGSITVIENKLLDLTLLNQRKILVLDNCPKEIHDYVYDNYLFDTPICLLSIDNKSAEPQGTVNLDDDFAIDIIQNISNQKFNPQVADFIVYNSKSNINEAVALIEASAEGDLIDYDNYQQKWNKILGESLIEDKGLLLLEELSLFTHVGYSGEFEIQSNFIKETLDYESNTDFISVIERLVEKRLINLTGDFIVLKVFIEELVVKRIERLANDNVAKYIENITNKGLSKQFGNRLIELSNQESKELIIDSIVGENGIASNYDFLNSDQGARIIMSLSEIAPVQTVKAITIALNEKSIDDLHGLEDGRRYIVWALERLCFRKETFCDATNILYRLALAENEEISNNATAQFCQLFQVSLAGTEVNLKERLDLISKLFDGSVETEYPLISKAIDRGLMVEGWMRMGGAEKQAGETLQDYWTNYNVEIQEYWDGLINILVKIGSDDAYNVIVKRLNHHLQLGNKDAILGAIELFLRKKGEIDKQLRQQFTIIQNSKEKYGEKQIEIIKGLVKRYSKNTIEEDLKTKVSEAPYNAVKTKTGEYENLAENITREYVNELSEAGNSEWLKVIEILLKGEQRQTFSFGHEWSKIKQKFVELIEIVIDKLKVIPSQEQNNSLLEGYLSGIEDESLIRGIIDKYLAIDEIKYHTLRMTRLLTINIDDLDKLKPLVIQDPNYVLSFQYMHLEHLTVNEATCFLDWFSKVKPHGSWTAIELIYDYLKKNEEKFEDLKEFIQNLLQIEGILSDESYYQLSFHYYKNLVGKLQNNGGLDSALVIFLSKEILLSTNQLNFNNEYQLSQILTILFDNYWDISWPIVSTSLVSKDFGGWYNLIRLLKDYKSFMDEKLLNWMDKDPQNHPPHVIHFVEFETQYDGEIIWSSLVLEMINRYGENKIFMDELSSVLHSWSAVGSAYQLLEGRKKLIELLLNHPNDSIKVFAQNETKYFEVLLKREGKFIQNINLEYN